MLFPGSHILSTDLQWLDLSLLTWQNFGVPKFRVSILKDLKLKSKSSLSLSSLMSSMANLLLFVIMESGVFLGV